MKTFSLKHKSFFLQMPPVSRAAPPPPIVTNKYVQDEKSSAIMSYRFLFI